MAKRTADLYALDVTWYKIKNRAYTQMEGRGDLFHGLVEVGPGELWNFVLVWDSISPATGSVASGSAIAFISQPKAIPSIAASLSLESSMRLD